MNKKRESFFLTGILAIVFSLNFVKAITPTEVLNSLADFVKPIAIYSVGGDLTGELLLVKVLLLILAIAILYSAVRLVPGIRENEFTIWIVTIVVSILSVRFLTTEALVNLVWLPNGVTGIALMSLLPFLIYFFYVENLNSSALRRTAWIFYSILFLAIALVRWEKLAVDSSKYIITNLAWIYIFTATISLLSFIFDKTIHARFLMSAIEKKGADLNALNIATLQTNIQNYRQIIANPASTPAQIITAQNQIKDLEKRIKILLKS
jgi:hypothetical protein